MRSQAYDLVLNGWELGSGSIRIHREDIQRQVFDALGITPEEAEARFGFLLGAFRYGAPPHGGFAVGIDRLVALLAGEENIREVIAFPKTQSGTDPMTGAPKALADDGAARARACGSRPGRLSPAGDGDRGRAPWRAGRRVAGVRRPRPLRPGRRRPAAPARAPLAARLRPRTLDDIVGQRHLVAPGRPAAGPGRAGPAHLGHPVGAAGDGEDDPGPGGGGHRRPRPSCPCRP